MRYAAALHVPSCLNNSWMRCFLASYSRFSSSVRVTQVDNSRTSNCLSNRLRSSARSSSESELGMTHPRERSCIKDCKRCMLEVANGKLMPRFALSLHYVSGTLNTALNGLLLVTRQIGQFCNIFFGCAVDDATHNRRISTISPGYLIAARACWPRLLPGSCRGLDGCRCLSGVVAGANRICVPLRARIVTGDQ